MIQPDFTLSSKSPGKKSWNIFMAKNGENYIIMHTIYNFDRKNPENSLKEVLPEFTLSSKNPGENSWNMFMAKNAEKYNSKDTKCNFYRNYPENSFRQVRNTEYHISRNNNLRIKNTQNHIRMDKTCKFTELGLKLEYILSSLRWPPPKLAKTETRP